MKTFTRRQALAGAIGTAGIFATGSAFGRAAMAACGLTPRQPEGPFYPEVDQKDKDTDLTYVLGRQGRAEGQVMYVHGVVTNQACRPEEGVLVDIWQACASGKYNHAGDPNPAPLDPNFQYWGKAVTDSQGRYRFKTILPGAYPAGDGWIRPPHIHFKVSRRGYHELITQLYFEGDELNERDLILRQIPRAEWPRVVVKRDRPDATMEPDSESCRFDLTLVKLEF